MSPAIAIEQKTTSKNPRSTVATVTEIYDYLRLLFARAGTPHCPSCGRVIQSRSPQEIVDGLAALGERARLTLLAPIVTQRKGDPQKHIRAPAERRLCAGAGGWPAYTSLSIATGAGKEYKKHTIEAVIDRIIIKDGVSRRLDR